jgi:twitching motility protein PilT
MTQKKLKELPFVDLYVCTEGDEPPHFSTTVTVRGMMKYPNSTLGQEYSEDIERLTQHLYGLRQADISMISYDGMRLRTATIATANGQKWVALRKVKDLPPALETLGFPPGLIPHLKKLGRRSGLILLCGATGQGKTTTCCSLLLDYMINYGGIAFTIEDPVEYNLAGRQGENGYCYQVEVHQDREWGEMLQRSLRCHPKYIFIGEVLTPDAANQLLRAATSGHLVIATVHAGSLQEGLEGLLQLAEQEIGLRATQLLASSLCAVIFQTLGEFGLTTSSVLVDLGTQGPAIRNLIRENHIGQIVSFIDKQHAIISQGEQPGTKNP